jgi:hypothetical protein
MASRAGETAGWDVEDLAEIVHAADHLAYLGI